jgi:hypothetical protein
MPFNVARHARLRRKNKQTGWLMAELAFVLMVTAILAAKSFGQVIKTIDETNSISTGKYAIEVQGGVNKYVEFNDVALKAGQPVAGFANPLQPKISELIAAKYLPLGFAPSTPLGPDMKVVMTMSGTCPDCTIDGVAYTTKPYQDVDGTVRVDVLSYAVNQIGPDGGVSMPSSPTLLTSLGGGTMPNPSNVAGTLAVRVGAGSGMLPLLSQYYRLDGSKALTGAMNANNNDINAVGNLQVNGKTTTSSLTVTNDTTFEATGVPGTTCSVDKSVRRNDSGTGLVACSGGVWQLVGNAVAGVGDGSPCTSPGLLGSDPTGISFVCNGSYWTTVNTFANLSDSCAPAGKVATSIATREQLVCKNGSFIKLVNLIAKSVEVSRQLVNDGTVVAKPACDTGGTPAYSLQLTQTVVDVSVTPPRQAMYVTATDNGSTWSVVLRVKDNASGDYSANDYSVSAVMKLECAY